MNKNTITAAVTTATLAAAALGGTAVVANSVDSKDIKNNSVTTTDLKDGSLKSADVRDGSLKAQDFASGQLLAGPQGPAGPPGAEGKAGATDVVVRRTSVTVPPGQVRVATAECQAGEIAVAGGGFIAQPTDLIFHGGVKGSAPFANGAIPADGQPATGWSVVGRNEEGTAQALIVTALCARP